METGLSQLRQVVRRLWRTPLFTVVTLITLAAGVGANIAVFSVVEGVLLKPLPYPHPEQLVGVWHTAPGLNIDEVNMAPSNYFIYHEQNRVFEDMGIYTGDSVAVTGQGNPEQVEAVDLTEGVLPVMGVRPMLGRLFNADDMKPGSGETVMLDYSYWQKRLNSDRGIVGRTITLDGKQHVVIGVMPRGFRFLDWEPQAMYLPAKIDRGKTFLGQFNYQGIARLRPGVTLAEANNDIARMIPTVWRSFPPPPGFSVQLFLNARFAPNVRPLSRDVVGDIGKLLWVLMGSIGVVLLIACANVANLLLVRAEGRHQELAVRSALGAGRWRIAQDFLLESVVLGAMGGVAGLGVAWGALRLLKAIAPQGLPRLQEIGIDWMVLGFTMGVALLCSLLFGSIPALRYARTGMGTGLREGGRSVSEGRERHRTRNALVVIQVSLAFVLLICSGLMIRTFFALTHGDAGYDTKAGIQTVRLNIPDAEVPKAENVTRLEQAIAEKIATVPGVKGVGFSSAVPMDGSRWQDPVVAQDRSYASGSVPPLRYFRFVSPGFLQTMGIPLVAGREFTWTENYQELPVAMVSENFAREYWGGAAQALGKHIRVTTKDDWREIVGVVGDQHADGMNKDAPTIAYWPVLMRHFEGGDSDGANVRRYVVYAIRSERAGSQSLMRDVGQAIWSVDANLPLSDVHPQSYYYNKSMARTSFTLVMLGIAASIALLLGIVGLYGVIAYSASQRKREIGIRIALGAQRNAITGMFVRQGLVLAGSGVACGVVVALAATRLLRAQLYHVSPMDPLTYGFAICALCGAAALASYLPSRRTAAVDPVKALRAE